MGSLLQHFLPSATMVKLLQFLCIISAAIAYASAIKCHRCLDNPIWVNLPGYDEDCGNPDYDNGDRDHVQEGENPGFTCGTAVYEDGSVERYLQSIANHEDGDCYTSAGFYTSCFCTGDMCNTGSLCEHCFDAKH